MKPVVDRLAKEYAGRIEIRRMDTSTDAEAQARADDYGVRYVPTFIFFDAAGSKVAQYVGELSESQLRAELESLL